MNQQFVKNLILSPLIEKKYIYREAKDIVDDKCYEPALLDYCYLCFFEALGAYRTDLSSSNWEFRVEIGDKAHLVHFDVENLYHLFGISKLALKKAIIINKILKQEYNKCPRDNMRYFAGFEMFRKLNYIFQQRGNDIKQYDCNIVNTEQEKLNWDKVATKLFCFLNIGELSQGETIYYHDKDKLLFERTLISTAPNKEDVLLIEFAPETNNSRIYNPVSIRIHPKTKTRRYELGSESTRKNYTRFKNLKKGYSTIDKRRV
ncbi:MAG: hypothetical protein IJ509_02780 [Bacilli bacterium]|nr:hypothetical protein [Bacilli bacterium]